MQRRVELVVSPERTEELVGDIRRLDGLLGLRVQHGISRHPPGDLIAVETLSRTHLELMELLERRRVGSDPSSSITISETKAVVSPSAAAALPSERSECGWEQMQALVAKESNMTRNALLIMGAAGAVAAVGITSGAVHLVIGAMLIAPGFEPIIRIPLGWASGTPGSRRGLLDLLRAYAVLVIAALLAGLLLRTSALPLLQQGSAYEAVPSLVAYWTSASLGSVLVALVGGFGGALLIASDRSVLTAGVMVSLALIPTAALIGVGVAAGDWPLAGRAAARWGLEVFLVLLGSFLFFAWYRARVQRRPSMLG